MAIISYESVAIVADASHTPSSQAFGDSPAVGVGVQAARSDHKHGFYGSAGIYGTFFGNNAGNGTMTGAANSFFGASTGPAVTSGSGNAFFGFQAGQVNTTGYNNCFFGAFAGSATLGGYSNVFIGYGAGRSNTSGYHNIFIGYFAGYSNVSGSDSVLLGWSAGYYETNNNRLYIDNAQRASLSDAIIKALIYGVFDAAPANQLLSFNAAKINMPYLPTADPHVAGQLWRSTNTVMVSTG